MKQILVEEKGRNGNMYRIEYNPCGLGMKYAIRYKRPGEGGYRYDTSWNTMGEARSYFEMLLKGGRR